jgi:hypothetical protein
MEIVYDRAERSAVSSIARRNSTAFLYETRSSQEGLKALQTVLNETPLYARLDVAGTTLRDWLLLRRGLYESLMKQRGSEYVTELLSQSEGQVWRGLNALTALVHNQRKAVEIASASTRLAALDECTQEHLINWGYVLADMALGIRDSWRLYTRGNYELLRRLAFEDLYKKWGRFDIATGFEVPYQIHPEVQTTEYIELSRRQPVPLRSRCSLHGGG